MNDQSNTPSTTQIVPVSAPSVSRWRAGWQAVGAEWKRWRDALRGQGDFVFKVLFLGILSGFPQILFFSLLPLWLKTAGMKLSGIAMFGAVGMFFAFNWVLAPLMDGFTALNLDRRRFWLLVSQAMLLVFCFQVALIGISPHPVSFFFLSLFIIGLAFASAMQDVSIDALRIELVPDDRPDLLAFASSLSVIGWYTGFYIGGGIGLNIFSWLNAHPNSNALQQWQTVYYIMALFLLVMMVATQWVFRHRQMTALSPRPASKKIWLEEIFVRPFSSLIHSKGWRITLMLLAFLFLFRLGEAFLGRMAIVFYKDIGYTENEIASYAKYFGWVFTVIFTFFSGLLAGRIGVWRGIMIGGIAMASTNLLFALIAVVHPPNVWLLAFTVVSDNLTTAFATVSIVTFISALCDKHYTASQYALFASVSSASRMLLASSAGWLVEKPFHHNWALFFIFTALMVIPSLVILWFMHDTAIFADFDNQKKKENTQNG